MKKIGLLFLAIPLLISTSCEKEDKCFNQIHGICIPDADFFDELIKDGVDKDGDGHISKAEAEAITKLEFHTDRVADMTGIEAFVNLDTLSCIYHEFYPTLGDMMTRGALAGLDVSQITALKYLNCSGNRITNLDLSNNPALESLICGYNPLPFLDLSNNIELRELRCYKNQLTTLDVLLNTALTELSCNGNQLSSLDVSNNTELLILDCKDNQFTTLDVSNNTKLTRLFCSRNQLTSLDVSNNTELTRLSCSENYLTSLDVSRNYRITRLHISYMPSLGQVCVWEMPFPPVGVRISVYGSLSVFFTTDCSK